MTDADHSDSACSAHSAPQSLIERYSPSDLSVFTGPERDKFLGPHGVDGMLALDGDAHAWQRIAPHVVWEILYRKEPHLYERLIAGERIHPCILDWLPDRIERCVEVAAGTGRLTVDLAPRCGEIVAVEPCKQLRRMLAAKLKRGRAVHGFFDGIPVDDGWADVVISLSALTVNEWHGGEAGLREMERVARPDGLIVLVWPSDPHWLTEQGFEYVSFDGDMTVEFSTVHEAVALAKIFYPHAASEITDRAVPYDLLGMNPPCDLAWKRTK